MALLSPGAQITVTDESFSAGSGPGTVPLIFVATKQDKTTPDGTATAEGTTAATANNLYLISSQRELLQTFGNPDFNEVGGSAQNGYPLNEYGLLAAYSYLGLANRAYVIRADLDLTELEPVTTAPAGDPADDTYWVDLNNFTAGIFEWDGSDWVEKDVDTYLNTSDANLDGTNLPSGYITGDIIAVWSASSDSAGSPFRGHVEYFVLDASADWQKLGAAGAAPDFQWAPHTNVPAVNSTGAALSNGDVWLKTTTPNNGLSINLKRFDATLEQFVDLGTVPVYEDSYNYYSQTGVDATSITADTVVGFVDNTDGARTNGDPEAGDYQQDGAQADILLRQHNGESSVSVTGGAYTPLTNATPTIDITVGITTVSVAGLSQTMTIDAFVAAVNSTALVTAEGIVASKSTDGTAVILTSTTGQDFSLDGSGTGAGTDAGFTEGTAYSNFTDLDSVTGVTYAADTTQPTGDTVYGTYWYDPSFDVDLLVKNAGGYWDNADSVSNDVYVQADDPALTVSPSNGDVWVETDTGDDYPVLYRRISGAWVVVDNADQTTPLGIVFADARPTAETGTSAGTGINNGDNASTPDLDSDAPDPALYPAGTLLFNTRASGRNVKVWTEDAVTDDLAATNEVDRWVSASGLNNDGSLITGTAAQKQVVIDALASTITTNEDVRNDTIFYNLIAAPGFTELLDEMVALNIDRKEQAFVVGDSPFHLSSSSTDLQAWATNANNAAGNGDDGLVTTDANLGVYYPSGLSTNVDGSEVVVPASHMVLRQMAFNDQVAYPWFSPAGFARGTISNASAVGYLNSEDEFVAVSLNEGQRDTLYTNKVNPIATLPGRGIVIYGQKTRYATSGALDRVNVARLVNYVRYQADQLAQPFLFEPNDSITRKAVKEAFDSFLAGLVTLRGVSDFLVVVDESNNTAARIDRNELWVDIALQPTQAVEFIYIPIRLRNTGDDLNL